MFRATLPAVERARAAVGRAEVRLCLLGDVASPVLTRLTSQIAPALSGYGRWVGNLPGRRR